MIRVLLQGQLGNHLFQIATGLVLAARHGTEVVIDASLLPGVRHELDLRRLPVLKLAFPRRLASVTFNRFCQGLARRPAHQVLNYTAYREPSHVFDPAVAQLPDRVVLEGFFQNEAYFAAVADQLPGWFGLQASLARAPAIHRQAVAAPETVGLHVRRGDYLQLPGWQVCGPGYYQRAIKYFRRHVPGARFVIFSDDLAWCRTQFAPLEPVYVDNRTDPYGMLVDLALLSACSHQIIANSSFSWWAARLNASPRRRVVMPDRWRLDDAIPLATKQLAGAEIIATSP